MLDKYVARLLPPNEWGRLGLPAHVLPHDAERAVIMVVEDDAGHLVGRWFAYDTTVLEGLWIAPECRHHPGVAGRLFQAMTAELAGRSVPMAITLITDPEVARLAARHGLTDVEGKLWLLDLRRLIESAQQHYQPDDR
jgi:hypothetical protein